MSEQQAAPVIHGNTIRCHRCNGTGREREGKRSLLCGACRGRGYLPIASRVPITHRADPPTSAIAEREITTSGTLDAQVAEVYAAVCRWPGKTASELAKLHGKLDRYVFGKRLSLIAVAVDGAAPRSVVLIERGAVRACEVTGRPCVTWQPLGWRARGEGGQ